MKAWVVAVGLFSSACACSRGMDDDAGVVDSDVRLDAAMDDAMVALPDVGPTGPSCADARPRENAACIENGWFWLARWHTAIFHDERNRLDYPAAPLVPAYLETFLLDENEVTAADFSEFVQRTGRESIPDECGYLDVSREGDLESGLSPEVSGWEGGVPSLEYAERPVVCVTRADAAAFCADRGGRLPSAAEWMKSGSVPYPDFQRFPWGNSPPPESPQPWPELVRTWWDSYVSVGLGLTPGNNVRRPGASSLGVTALEVRDLSGNVSELLADCSDSLRSTYGGDRFDPLVRPRPPSTPCTADAVVAGSNWRTFAEFEAMLGQIVFVAREPTGPGDPGYTYPLDVRAWDSRTIANSFFGRSEPAPGTPLEQRGLARRNWRIGFRCAYEP